MKKIKKFKKSHKRHFIIEINEDIDGKVDNALKLLESGFIEQSDVVMKGLMAEHPGYHMVQYGMGLVHAYKKRYDEAIQRFIKALEIFPYFLEAQFNLAVSYQKKLDVGNAIKAYMKVSEMGVADDSLVKQASNFLSGMEENVRMNEGVGLNPYLRGMNKFENAFAHMERQEWEEAIEGFKECVSIVNRHFQSYGNMGICYAKLGKKKQALAALDKALEINPRYELAQVNRAMTLELEEGEILQDGPVESIDYSKDYAAKKKSYIAEVINTLKRR